MNLRLLFGSVNRFLPITCQVAAVAKLGELKGGRREDVSDEALVRQKTGTGLLSSNRRPD
jgi:hypothetical protein